MLNEVTRLCKGDFSNIVKEYEIIQADMFSSFVVAKFDTKKEAQNFLKQKEQEASYSCEFPTIFFIKAIKY